MCFRGASTTLIRDLGDVNPKVGSTLIRSGVDPAFVQVTALERKLKILWAVGRTIIGITVRDVGPGRCR